MGRAKLVGLVSSPAADAMCTSGLREACCNQFAPSSAAVPSRCVVRTRPPMRSRASMTVGVILLLVLHLVINVGLRRLIAHDPERPELEAGYLS